jgi:hypothetical protein
MMRAGFPAVQIRFPVLQGPLPVIPLGRSMSSPGPAPGYTKPLCLCDKLRQNDAERASKKKRSR